jgi:hypothetical protein
MLSPFSSNISLHSLLADFRVIILAGEHKRIRHQAVALAITTE